MASLAKRLPDNAPGDLYVDSTCIDCNACRRIAPATFEEAADHSFVREQPASEPDRRRALMALVACPTESIGTTSRQDVRPGLEAFPERIEDGVSFCGFTSERSFGAWSYLIERPAGNVLVDSPKAVPPAARRLRSPRRPCHDVPDAPGRRRRPRSVPPALRLRAGPAPGRLNRRHPRGRAASLGA